MRSCSMDAGTASSTARQQSKGVLTLAALHDELIELKRGRCVHHHGSGACWFDQGAASGPHTSFSPLSG